MKNRVEDGQYQSFVEEDGEEELEGDKEEQVKEDEDSHLLINKNCFIF